MGMVFIWWIGVIVGGSVICLGIYGVVVVFWEEVRSGGGGFVIGDG